MLFSERYKSAVLDKEGKWVDTISKDVTFQCKLWLTETMIEFDEPKKVKTSRYSDEYKNYGALTLVLYQYCHDFHPLFIDSMFSGYGSKYNTNQIAAIYTPFLFDLIEMQYAVLSKKEKNNFKLRINSIFDRFNLPWLFVDGKMVKIDPNQFEMDIKNKTIAMMAELKEKDSDFQSAYDDLIKSIEQFQKGEFPECIISANKSYESALKIYLNVAKGNAKALTGDFSKRAISGTGFNCSGFSDNILMSLPYIRNNSAAHGSGSEETSINKEIANLAINLACALITFVVSEYSKKEATNDE